MNAFDGVRFHHTSQAKTTDFGLKLRTSATGVQTDGDDDDQEEQLAAVESSSAAGQSTELAEGRPEGSWSRLLVELTPSLFQLKELRLKCRTVVEQPLIEYDSHLVVSLATSPFIQADRNQLARALRPSWPANGNRSLFQRHGTRQQQQQARRQSSVIRLRQHNAGLLQQSSSSSPSSTMAAPTATTCWALPLTATVIQLVVARTLFPPLG